MDRLGLREEDYGEADLLGLWPENVRAVQLFQHVRTQWRVGPGGAYGLDYNVLYYRMGRMSLDDESWRTLESEIQVMELAALEVMQK